MHIPTNYFHDRIVLLLLSISVFLTLLGSILIFLRLGSGRTDGYIVQYRANLGVSAFKSGSSRELLAFIVFSVLVLIINTLMSVRVYSQQRHYALTILSFGVLLLTLSIIVSNALLVLH